MKSCFGSMSEPWKQAPPAGPPSKSVCKQDDRYGNCGERRSRHEMKGGGLDYTEELCLLAFQQFMDKNSGT